MGSLNPFQTPKPAPIIVNEVAPTSTPESVADPAPSQKELDQKTSEARAKNILKRRRGRFGTIGTSFRGVLSRNDLSPRRKTLLGE